MITVTGLKPNILDNLKLKLILLRELLHGIKHNQNDNKIFVSQNS